MQQYGLILLAATIVANTSYALILRAAQKRGANEIAVGLVNYLFASGLYLTIGLLTRPVGSLTALGYGAIAGTSNVAIFLLLLAAMTIRGVAISVAVVRLAVVVPMTAAILVWGEVPDSLQIGGIALALLALPMLSLDRGVNHQPLTSRRLAILAGLFMANGITLLMLKAFQTTGYGAARPIYLGTMFFVGAVICGLVWARNPQPWHGTLEIKWGLLLGASNALINILILATLDVLLASVMFPILAAVGLALTTTFAAVVWREIPGRLGWAGIGLAVLAVVLANM